MKNIYLYTTISFILFFGLWFTYPYVFKSKPTSLDISEREVDCAFILLNAVSRGDIKFTGFEKEDRMLQYDNFINDCVKYTLTGEKIK